MAPRPSQGSCSAPLLALVVVLGLSACGGEAKPEPRTAREPAQEKDFDHLYGMRASGEVGGMNEEKVDATFTESVGALQACLNRGAERVEFLGGSVKFFLKIDLSGKVQHSHLEYSTLGDRETEKCMLNALRRLDWPPPVGGDVGLARKSFDFDPPNDVRPPAELDAGGLNGALSKLRDRARDCGAGGSNFEATVYLSTDGSVLAAGATPSDEAGEEAVDCLVEAIKETQFPSPGSWPAKGSFAL